MTTSNIALAQKTCFLAQEDDQVIVAEGDYQTRHAPCSTFKIPLSLMGFDADIFVDENTPEWPFQEGYEDYLERWKQPHTPQLWMTNSCLWVSQLLTQKLEMDTFQNYVARFDYGNQDLSGDVGKNNGLTNSWLSSSLEISPKEQMTFLRKLQRNELPVSLHAHEMTKKIIYLEELGDGWKLYGKSGSGSQLNPDRTKSDYKMGWFVGWIQKETAAPITFVQYIEDETVVPDYAGPRARKQAIQRLQQIIQDRQ